MSKYQLTHDDLLDHARDEVAFIERSAQAFDEGHEGEAKRLATAIRVLLHDTKNSHSLLAQLGVKERIDYVNTAEPINPRNLLPTAGLVMMRMTAGPGGGGAYVAPAAVDVPLSPSRINPNAQFKEWWEDPVTKAPDGNLHSRKTYILTVANKEGGAHVDASLDAAYVDLTKHNGLGWMYQSDDESGQPFEGNLGLASVRQIADEVVQTLQQHAATIGL